MDFTHDDYLLKDSDPEKTYYRRTNEQKKSIPWGQRKLFLTELQFLTRFWDSEQVPEPIIVYAGAAPGKHIPLLGYLFPQARFYLYDPRPFHISPSEKISIYQQYFTDEDASQWANRKDVFFISDIRTADYQQMGEEENENAIMTDMKMQEVWYHIIKPGFAHM